MPRIEHSFLELRNYVNPLSFEFFLKRLAESDHESVFSAGMLSHVVGTTIGRSVKSIEIVDEPYGVIDLDAFLNFLQKRYTGEEIRQYGLLLDITSRLNEAGELSKSLITNAALKTQGIDPKAIDLLRQEYLRFRIQKLFDSQNYTPQFAVVGASERFFQRLVVLINDEGNKAAGVFQLSSEFFIMGGDIFSACIFRDKPIFTISCCANESRGSVFLYTSRKCCKNENLF